MAKKKKKKTAKTPARKAARPARKTSRKPVPKPARKPAKRASAAPAGVRTVTTGGGASPGDVGRRLVDMFNAGKFKEIEKQFWSPGVVSCEGEGVSMEWVGRAAAERKGAEWYAHNRIHGASAEGPYVGATGFAVKFRMDIENIASGARNVTEEVGVYTVRNGKIVREEFMYGPAAASA